MSHLIIEQGNGVGREVAVPASGIKFGRSPANDLVVADERLMPFQGRFFFKSDGTLWMTDFSVGEKSRIAGVPVDERQLKVGDLVEVGSHAFRVIGTRQESAPPAEAIDLGFKPVRKAAGTSGTARGGEAKHASPVYRLLQVLVIVLLLLLVAVGVNEFVGSKGDSRTNGVRMQGLFFSYECVRADSKNIFRYALELAPDGVATLQVDDVLNRHFAKSARLPDDALAALNRKVAGHGFFKIDGDRIGDDADRYTLYDIALGCDGAFNHVRVQNRELPSDMRQLVSILEEFAFSALDVSMTLLKDDATLIRYAEESFRLAEDRYRERDAGYENIARAIKHLNEVIVYLETLDPKPEPFGKASDLLAAAKVEQNERYKDFMFLVDQAMRTDDWPEARRNLRILAQLIDDRSDERHEVISAKTLEVEDKLR